ncbi:hypothetical protein ASG96_16475 [Terrabacter sp. Soil810]|nr:hypothetical protein ASG96_16475 [Terrabacter sp. Soil810]
MRSSHFVPLRVQRDGTISVPGTAQEVGIYDADPTPGQLGPSVLAAHVDTPSGVPGIFHELGRVKAGDVVTVSRREGSHLTFTVDRVAAYTKTQFPTDLVYKGDVTRAEIRLVTCGGPDPTAATSTATTSWSSATCREPADAPADAPGLPRVPPVGTPRRTHGGLVRYVPRV